MWPSSWRGRTSGWTRNKQPTAIDVVLHESAFVAIIAVVQELLGLGRSPVAGFCAASRGSKPFVAAVPMLMMSVGRNALFHRHVCGDEVGFALRSGLLRALAARQGFGTGHVSGIVVLRDLRDCHGSGDARNQAPALWGTERAGLSLTEVQREDRATLLRRPAFWAAMVLAIFLIQPNQDGPLADVRYPASSAPCKACTPSRLPVKCSVIASRY